MNGRRALEAAFWLLLAAVLVALLIGNALGQPILLGYVETGSMEPTLEPGDGYVAVPASVAGPVEEDDVVVFEAKRLHGGGLTTHRVVEDTDQGYVTKGDANPFTDQDGVEPPVTDGQVVAKALRVDGEVVVVPHLGTAVTSVQGGLDRVQRTVASVFGLGSAGGSQGVAFLFLAIGVGLFALDALGGSAGRRDRDRTRSRSIPSRGALLLAAGAGVVFLAATASMVAASDTHEIGIVSAEFESDAPHVVPAGGSTQRTTTLANDGVVPTVVVLEPTSSGVDADPERRRLGGGETADATVTIDAPPDTGYYQRSLSEQRYLAVLPESALAALHGVHPWLARIAASATVALAFAVATAAVVGTGAGRLRRRTTVSLFGGRKR